MCDMTSEVVSDEVLAHYVCNGQCLPLIFVPGSAQELSLLQARVQMPLGLAAAALI